MEDFCCTQLWENVTLHPESWVSLLLLCYKLPQILWLKTSKHLCIQIFIAAESKQIQLSFLLRISQGQNQDGSQLGTSVEALEDNLLADSFNLLTELVPYGCRIEVPVFSLALREKGHPYAQQFMKPEVPQQIRVHPFNHFDFWCCQREKIPRSERTGRFNWSD